MGTDVNYDEFSMFRDNCTDAGLDWPGDPVVERVTTTAADGRTVSALKWGSGAPEIVLLHGGAQNAHTWDTLNLALGRPALAIDLAGHGHSDWRPEQDYVPQVLALDVAEVVAAHAAEARFLVGMSLGGLTALCHAASKPAGLEQLVMLDVSPGVDHAKAEPVITFVSGPEFFESFDEILARTMEHNPTRTESSLRRGILHNARQLDDGRWSWRYDPMRSWKSAGEDAPMFGSLWDAVSEVEVPITLLLGTVWSAVDEADVTEFRRRQPDLVVHEVPDAGHSIQGDQPVALAALLADIVGE